jgi:hypothetical protein
MKKNKGLIFLTVLLIIVLDIVVVRIAARKNTQDASTDVVPVTLYDRGINLIQEMNTIINDENYRKMIGVSEELESNVDELAEMDYTQPKAVYRVTNLEDYVNLAMYMSEVDENSYKGEAKEYADKVLKANLGTTLMAQVSGTMAIAASSLVKKTDMFVDTSVTETEVYVYIYDEAYPVFVSFTPGEDGAVSATGTYVIVDALIGADADTAGNTLSVSPFKLEIEEVIEEVTEEVTEEITDK